MMIKHHKRIARRRSQLGSAVVAAAAAIAVLLPGATDARASGGPREPVQAKPASCTGKHWVGVWSASPTDAHAQFSRSLAGQTARTVLTPHGSGEKLRVHLTNVMSPEPVTIGAA